MEFLPEIDTMLKRTCERNNLEIESRGDVKLTFDEAYEFYSPHGDKWFREPMARQISSEELYAYIIKGAYAIKIIRRLLGPTDPADARSGAPGTIRGLFAEGCMAALAKLMLVIDNCGHATSKVKDAEREVEIIEQALSR